MGCRCQDRLCVERARDLTPRCRAPPLPGGEGAQIPVDPGHGCQPSEARSPSGRGAARREVAQTSMHGHGRSTQTSPWRYQPDSGKSMDVIAVKSERCDPSRRALFEKIRKNDHRGGLAGGHETQNGGRSGLLPARRGRTGVVLARAADFAPVAAVAMGVDQLAGGSAGVASSSVWVTPERRSEGRVRSVRASSPARVAYSMSRALRCVCSAWRSRFVKPPQIAEVGRPGGASGWQAGVGRVPRLHPQANECRRPCRGFRKDVDSPAELNSSTLPRNWIESLLAFESPGRGACIR